MLENQPAAIILHSRFQTTSTTSCEMGGWGFPWVRHHRFPEWTCNCGCVLLSVLFSATYHKWKWGNTMKGKLISIAHVHRRVCHEPGKKTGLLKPGVEKLVSCSITREPIHKRQQACKYAITDSKPPWTRLRSLRWTITEISTVAKFNKSRCLTWFFPPLSFCFFARFFLPSMAVIIGLCGHLYECSISWGLEDVMGEST